MFARKMLPAPRPARRKTPRRPQIEDLEGRTLLSTGGLSFGATVASQPVAVGGELVFAASDATHGTQLWETNRTTTSMLTALNEASGGINPTDLTAVGGIVYFAADDGPDGQQLWETDGTASGTKMITDSNDGAAGLGIYPSDLTNVNGTLYFQGFDLNHGYQLFTSDGTAAGTKMVADINGGTSSYPADLTAVGGTLFFQATDATHGNQVWSYNTSTGAKTLLTTADASGGGVYPQELTAAGSELYFAGYDPSHGYQLWSSNGTASGTAIVTSINDAGGGLAPGGMAAVGNTVYFEGTDGAHGYQLWSSTGTASGTTMLTGGNVSGGGLSPSNLTAMGGELYFSANDGVHGTQLWSSTGTASGTGMVADINGTSSAIPSNLTPSGGTLYFSAFTKSAGYQLWQTNGTSSGTTQDTTISHSTPMGNFAVMGSDVFFTDAGASLWEWQPASQTTPTITWPTPASIVYGTALSATQLDATASVAGTFAYSPASGTVPGAGIDTLSVTFTPTDTTDYTTATASVTLAVTQATPKTTWASPASIVYGTALSATQLDATASVAGTFVYSPGAGTILKAGSDTLSVTFTPADSADYTTATATTTIIVAQATPAIAWPNPAGIVYGTPLSSAQLDATASVPGSFAYSPAAGTVLEAGSDTLSVTFTPADSADYTAATATTTIAVAQATPAIAWPNPAGIVYGTPLSSAQLDAAASIPGSFAYSPAAGTVLEAGSDTLSVTFTPADSADYTAATATTTITVAQAAPAIAWPNPAGIVYGTPLSSAQLDATASVPGSFAYSPAAGAVLKAGSDTLSVTFTPADSADYTAATATTTIAVAQATPAIAWPNPAGIVYGTPLSSAQLDATASVPGSFAYSPAAGAVLKAGSDTLSVTFTPTDSADYTAATATTTITVAQAAPAIAWPNPAGIIYGTPLSSAQLDATANVPGSFAYSPAAGAVLKAGSDTLSVTFTPADSTDYATVTSTATIVVTPEMATFLKQDATTSGNWIGAYGQDGSDIQGYAAALPSYASVSFSANATPYTWSTATSDTRAPQNPANPAGSRVAAAWYNNSGSSFTIGVNLTDGQAHDLTLYFLDWYSGGRKESVQISDAASGTVLDTESVSSFGGGTYLQWEVSGRVVIKVSAVVGANAVLSGLFFDPPAPATATAAAKFREQDATTSGNWIGAYGQDGSDIQGYAAALPSYASVSFSANATPYTWSTATSDTRAPQYPANPAGSRVAAAWYNNSGSSFTIGVNLTDGQAHDLTLYFLDWYSGGRKESVQISDAASGTVLDTESVSSFGGGTYLQWEVSGRVVIKVSAVVGANAVLSGLFFDPASVGSSTALSSIRLGASSARPTWVAVVPTDTSDSATFPGPADVGVPPATTAATIAPTGTAAPTVTVGQAHPRRRRPSHRRPATGPVAVAKPPAGLRISRVAAVQGASLSGDGARA